MASDRDRDVRRRAHHFGLGTEAQSKGVVADGIGGAVVGAALGVLVGLLLSAPVVAVAVLVVVGLVAGGACGLLFWGVRVPEPADVVAGGDDPVADDRPARHERERERELVGARH